MWSVSKIGDDYCSCATIQLISVCQLSCTNSIQDAADCIHAYCTIPHTISVVDLLLMLLLLLRLLMLLFCSYHPGRNWFPELRNVQRARATVRSTISVIPYRSIRCDRRREALSCIGFLLPTQTQQRWSMWCDDAENEISSFWEYVDRDNAKVQTSFQFSMFVHFT